MKILHRHQWVVTGRTAIDPMVQFWLLVPSIANEHVRCECGATGVRSIPPRPRRWWEPGGAYYRVRAEPDA